MRFVILVGIVSLFILYISLTDYKRQVQHFLLWYGKGMLHPMQVENKQYHTERIHWGFEPPPSCCEVGTVTTTPLYNPDFSGISGTPITLKSVELVP